MAGTALLVAAVLVAGGCGAIRKAVNDRTFGGNKPGKARVEYNLRRRMTVPELKRDNSDFPGKVELEDDVEVMFQPNMDDVAHAVARQARDVILATEERLGLDVPKVRLCMMWVDKMPQNVSVSWTADDSFPVPVFVPVGARPSDPILAENAIAPSMWIHEVVEMTLIRPTMPPTVAGDLEFGPFRVCNYTRWFCEGLANYAGYIAARQIDEDAMPPNGRSGRSDVFLWLKPLSSLGKVGKDLFEWHQFSDDARNHDYYSAALGLFLLIEHRFGEEGIRAVVTALPREGYVDGPGLIDLVNETLTVDIRELALAFSFPETNMKVTALTPAVAARKGLEIQGGLLVTAVDKESPAARAGIEEGDILTAVNGRSVGSNLELELAILDSLTKGSMAVTARRGETLHELAVGLGAPARR